MHVLIDGGRLAKLDQHDVIVNVVGAVVWVADDTRGGDELLFALSGLDVVLTKTHFNTSVEGK